MCTLRPCAKSWGNSRGWCTRCAASGIGCWSARKKRPRCNVAARDSLKAGLRTASARTIPAMPPLLSIVSPMYNEAENLGEFVRQVHIAIDPLPIEWELLLVNDGSKDATLQRAKEVAAGDPHLRVVSFSRNFGHEA